MGKSALILIMVILIFGCGKQEIYDERLQPEKIQDSSEKTQDSTSLEGYVEEYNELKQEIEILSNNHPSIGKERFESLRDRVYFFKGKISGSEFIELEEQLFKIKVAGSETDKSRETEHQTSESNEIKRGLLSPRGCEGNGSFMLGASPLALVELEKIRPMGGLSSSHITPTDHQYWDTIGQNTVEGKDIDRFKVYAPADGYIVEIEFGKDHRIIIEHSCTFYTIFIHVDRLSDKVLSSIKPEDGDIKTHVWPRIFVEQGEAIGSIGTGKLDFSVVDEGVTLKDFVKLESYEGEIWKKHTVDTFDYYEEPLRSKLLAKNVRMVAPLGGKIDYDIKGKLVGNWFLDGTGGYRGLGNENYWTSHLSIVYDSIDPTQIRIGIGDFGNTSMIFGIAGNAPDPKNIGPESGIVKYELVIFDYFITTGKWDKNKFAQNISGKNTNEVRGIALFQVLDNDKIKAEFFPGKTSDQVKGFTSSARTYER